MATATAKRSAATFLLGSLIGKAVIMSAVTTIMIAKTTRGVDIVGCVTLNCTEIDEEQYCEGFQPGVCCDFGGRTDLGSVLFDSLPDSTTGYTYVGGGCGFSSGLNPAVGPGKQCTGALAPSGAAYYNDDEEESNFARIIMRPNAFRYYFDFDKNGYWVVNAAPENLSDVQKQFRGVPAEGKLAWLQSYGARYKTMTAK